MTRTSHIDWSSSVELARRAHLSQGYLALGLCLWSAISVAVGWWLRGTSAGEDDAAHSRPVVRALVDDSLDLPEGPWMIDALRFVRGKGLEAKVVSRGPEELALRISNSDGFSGSVIDLDVHRDAQGRFSARPTVRRYNDQETPAVRDVRIHSGRVALSSDPWLPLGELVLEFELHGTCGTPTSLTGRVPVRF
jgi:hypothetical protein